MRTLNARLTWVGIALAPAVMVLWLVLAQATKAAYLANEFAVVAAMLAACVVSALAVAFLSRLKLWLRVIGALGYLAISLFAAVAVLGVTGILAA